MNLRVGVGIFVFIFSSISVFSQVFPTPTPTRQRVVGNNPQPSPTAMPFATPVPKVVVVTSNLPSPTPSPIPAPKPSVMPTQTTVPAAATPSNTTIQPTQPAPQYLYPASSLKLGEIKNKLEEAKRQMLARPITIALLDSLVATNIVRIAFYDYDTHQIDYVVMSKDTFLTKGAQYATVSSNAKNVTVQIIRANGVNTPVTIIDAKNKAHLPLMAQYPVVRDGKFIETAYYISTHPGIMTPEVITAGKYYIRNTLDVAREKLQQKGVFISPQIADIAERLAVVEHIDPLRFRTEFQSNLFNEVYALYALNEGQTYRYAVSWAGAGGMAQMIPSTYFMIRTRYSNVGLMPDFVEGMRNHLNAAQAMLLYMQMTWSDLISNPTVFDAVQNGIATPAELMSAGYNSNPAKLPGFIKRSGANWRYAIPRETQMYLQINASMDRYFPMTARTK